MNLDDDFDTVDELPAGPHRKLSDADLELLQLAARALGAVQVDEVDGEDWLFVHFADGTTMHGWNPLLFSNDAFELQVRLRLTLEVFHDRVIAKRYFGHNGQFKFMLAQEKPDDDASAAVRRAVTRVAAQIGNLTE